MRIQDDSEADILLLVLRDGPSMDAIEEPGEVIVSYGEGKEPVSVELLNATVGQLMSPGSADYPSPEHQLL